MFGEIRSLLQDKPSAQGWEELCHVISEWRGPEDLETLVMPYILSHLQEWPHAMRRTPLRWKEGLVRGARLPFGPLVKVLDGAELKLRNEDLLTLARAPVMSHVEAIDLSRNVFGWRGLSHLLTSAPSRERWRALRLAPTAVGVEGLRLIADTPGLSRLEVLSLSNVRTSPEGLHALMNSAHLSALNTLVLAHNDMTERHIEALVDGERFTQLETLVLGHNPLGSRGVIRLFHQRRTQHLEALDLCACGLTTPVAELLSQSRALPRLKRLRLAQNPLVRRVEVFDGARLFRNLEGLDVSGEEGEERASAMRLLEKGVLGGLEVLAISRRAHDARIVQLAVDRGIELVDRLPLPIAMLGEQ